MITASTNNILNIMDWCLSNDVNYTLDMINSNPLHGQYIINFADRNDEFVVKLRFGL